MSAVVADTHALIWYLDVPSRLSANAVAALDGATASGNPIFISAISVVEIVYLVDKGRLSTSTLDRLYSTLNSEDSAIAVVPVDLAVARTVHLVSRDVVPDMPDRIIAATSLNLDLPLVTKDAKIRAANVTTIW